MAKKKQLSVKRPPQRGGTLMGMRSGFRKMTGAEKRKVATTRISPALQRAFVIGVGVIIAVVLVWGLAKR